MKKGIVGKALLAIITGLLLSLGPRAHADATVYWDLDNGFDPTTVVIGPGESVTWWNYDVYNLDTYVTFDNGFSFNLPNGSGVEVVFPSQAGAYGYQSQIGDHGTVIVNVAPTVAITSPANDAVFSAPATFTIEATADDTADDSVSDVEFFLGTSDSTNSIEDVYSPPFRTGITNLATGTYTLIAVARDSHGWTTTDAVTITVGSSVPVELSAPKMSADGFLFDVTGLTVGKTNIVQVSTNLISWTPVQTNIATSASLTVTNVPTLTRQFYRILQLP